MSINISDKPEVNVVNVGDEVSADQIAAIQESSAATALNPFATISDIAGGGAGAALLLSGGTMTGNIAWSAGGQFIGVGLDDFGLGGYAGLSQVCSVGYDLNWQAGWLTAFEQNRVTTRPLFLNSGYGTSLKVWDYNTNKGTEISHTGFSVSAEGGSEFDFDGFGLTNNYTPYHARAMFTPIQVGITDTDTNNSIYFQPDGLHFPDGSFQSTAGGGFSGAKKAFSGIVANGTTLTAQDFATWAVSNGSSIDDIGAVGATRIKYTIVLEYDVPSAVTITSSPAGSFILVEGTYSSISSGGASNGWTLDSSVGETYTYIGGSDKKVIIKHEIITETFAMGWSPCVAFGISTDAGTVDYTVSATIIAEVIL